jgi:TonB family protein
MSTDVSSRRRDRTAILGSIAFHLCVLSALVALRPPVFPTEEPDERALIAGIIRFERAPARHRLPAAPRAAPATPAPRPIERPVVHTAVVHEKTHSLPVVATEPRYAPVVAHRPASRPARIAATPTQTPTAMPEPSAAARVAVAAEPPALPSATPATDVPAERDAGPGNFGESYPARPMPGMLEALRSRLSGHVVVRVAVDERGRATNVVIVSGIDDPALRDEVTRTLLAASYIPASCNGLGCAATVELRT